MITGWPGKNLATFARRVLSSGRGITAPFTFTTPSLERLTIISPGRRSGCSEVFDAGSLIEISLSHCEKTLTVTKKQRSRKMTSSIDVKATAGALEALSAPNFILSPGARYFFDGDLKLGDALRRAPAE